LAIAMRDGKPVDLGLPPPDLSGGLREARQRPPDVAGDGGQFGAVISPPSASYSAGQTVTAGFVGANPNNSLRRGDTYLEVQREVAGAWLRIADDGDWSTKLRWKKDGKAGSHVTVTWDIPADAAAGSYRIAYHGDSRDEHGILTPFTGVTNAFAVTG
jgi:neutral ceramidase